MRDTQAVLGKASAGWGKHPDSELNELEEMASRELTRSSRLMHGAFVCS
jgi:hypothetical protein